MPMPSARPTCRPPAPQARWDFTARRGRRSLIVPDVPVTSIAWSWWRSTPPTIVTSKRHVGLPRGCARSWLALPAGAHRSGLLLRFRLFFLFLGGRSFLWLLVILHRTQVVEERHVVRFFRVLEADH